MSADVFPLLTEHLGLVAWATTEQGDVLGPVAPVGVGIVPRDETGFDVYIQFVFEYRARHAASCSEAQIHIGGTTRFHKFPRAPLQDGDRLTVHFTLHSFWAEENAWRPRLIGT